MLDSMRAFRRHQNQLHRTSNGGVRGESRNRVGLGCTDPKGSGAPSPPSFPSLLLSPFGHSLLSPLPLSLHLSHFLFYFLSSLPISLSFNLGHTRGSIRFCSKNLKPSKNIEITILSLFLLAHNFFVITPNHVLLTSTHSC